MTIVIHLHAGNFSLLTASDTQETYAGEAKIDSGKIIGYWRANPLGAINIAGCGWSDYALALSQDIVRCFKDFSGSYAELEDAIRRIVRGFHEVHIYPYVGKLEDSNVPNCSLLIAVRHGSVSKLLATRGTLVTESTPFDCEGIGRPVATSLLNKLYPVYPTLDSIAILAAYAIYRVKTSVDGCGLKTEIRFIYQDRLGVVPFELIEKWESLFRRYGRLEHDCFYHAMNFITCPPSPPAMKISLPLQMKPLPEIISEIEKMRTEFSESTIFPSFGEK